MKNLIVFLLTFMSIGLSGCLDEITTTEILEVVPTDPTQCVVTVQTARIDIGRSEDAEIFFTRAQTLRVSQQGCIGGHGVTQITMCLANDIDGDRSIGKTYRKVPGVPVGANELLIQGVVSIHAHDSLYETQAAATASWVNGLAILSLDTSDFLGRGEFYIDLDTTLQNSHNGFSAVRITPNPYRNKQSCNGKGAIVSGDFDLAIVGILPSEVSTSNLLPQCQGLNCKG